MGKGSEVKERQERRREGEREGKREGEKEEGRIVCSFVSFSYFI